MKTKFFIAIILFAFAANIRANDVVRNNYDDIGGFFETASNVESPNVEYFYISKAMLALTRGKVNVSGVKEGLNLDDFYNKIDFIRSVAVTANTSAKEQNLLEGAEGLAKRVYKQYDYLNLMVSSEGGRRAYIFYKYGEGGLCSLLVVVTKKKELPGGQTALDFARVLLMGGTFRVEDIPMLITNF